MTAAQSLDILSDRYGFVGDYIPVRHWRPGAPYFWRRVVYAVSLDDVGMAGHLPLWRITYNVRHWPYDEGTPHIIRHTADAGSISNGKLAEIAGG